MRLSIPKSAGGRLVLAIALAGAGFGLFLTVSSPVKEVASYTSTIGPAERILAVNGRIRPRLQVDIRPPAGGALVELPFDVGHRVNLGDVLARIDDGPEAAAIAVAQAAVQSQQAILAQAQRDLTRYEALGEFATVKDVEQRRLAVVEGERELKRRTAAVSQATELRERRVLRAPFTGVILERPVDPGQNVGPENVIYRLADLSTPEIVAEVDEIYAAEIHPGMEALVSVPGQSDTVRATVLHIEPRVDPGTGARDVRFTLDGALTDRPAGLTVTINIVIERRTNAVKIPRRAIRQAGGKMSVLIAGPDGIVRDRVVTIVDWPAEDVIVTHGLEAGEHVLLSPTAAKPGEKVRIIN